MGLGGQEPRQATPVQWTLATLPLTLCLPCPTSCEASGAAPLPVGGGSLEVLQCPELKGWGSQAGWE